MRYMRLNYKKDMLQQNCCFELQSSSYGIHGSTGDYHLNKIFYPDDNDVPDSYRKSLDLDYLEVPQIFRRLEW